MPITPFHMGPALVLKAAARERFSLVVFGLSQVAIDVEPGLGLVRGSPVLHGPSHTFVGATAIGAACAVLGRPLAERLLALWCGRSVRVSRGAAWAGAFVGTYSHIILDGMMHLDMRPFAPFGDANPMLGALSVPAIYLLCVASGVVGAAVLGMRRTPW